MPPTVAGRTELHTGTARRVGHNGRRSSARHVPYFFPPSWAPNIVLA